MDLALHGGAHGATPTMIGGQLAHLPVAVWGIVWVVFPEVPLRQRAAAYGTTLRPKTELIAKECAEPLGRETLSRNGYVCQAPHRQTTTG